MSTSDILTAVDMSDVRRPTFTLRAPAGTITVLDLPHKSGKFVAIDSPDIRVTGWDQATAETSARTIERAAELESDLRRFGYEMSYSNDWQVTLYTNVPEAR